MTHRHSSSYHLSIHYDVILSLIKSHWHVSVHMISPTTIWVWSWLNLEPTYTKMTLILLLWIHQELIWNKTQLSLVESSTHLALQQLISFSIHKYKINFFTLCDKDHTVGINIGIYYWFVLRWFCLLICKCSL